MAYKPTVAVDFDGVLHSYEKGWHDGTIYGKPIKGSKKALKKLSKKYNIVIFTCREDLIGITKWIKKHYNIGHFTVTNQKPKAKLYIDDRGIRFTSWEQTLNDVEEYDGPLQ